MKDYTDQLGCCEFVLGQHWTPSQTCELRIGVPELWWVVFNENNDLCIVIDAHTGEDGDIVEELVPVTELNMKRIWGGN